MEKYTVEVFNTLTNRYEEVEVNEETYLFYKRSQWLMDKKDERFSEHQKVFSDFGDGNADLDKTREFMEASESLFAETEDKSNLIETEIRRVMETLDESERSLIEAVYFSKMSEKAYGEMMGVSQQAVHKRKTRILRKMREITKKFD